MSSSREKPAHDRSPRRPVGLLAAGVFVGLLVVVGGIVVATGSGEHDNAAPHPTTSLAPAPAPGGATGFGAPEVDVFGRRIDVPNNAYGQVLDQTVPGHNPSDPDWLTAAPAGLRARGGWQRVSGAVVPFSTSDGPTGMREGVPTGYAHTPQGAALAAVYAAWETVARPSDRALREGMVVMSPGELAQFDLLKAQGRLPDRPESVTRWLLAPDAFRVDSWAPDLCVVQIAGRAGPDQNGTKRWMSNQIAMIWDGTSWRMRLAADQRLPQEMIYSLAGWTPW